MTNTFFNNWAVLERTFAKNVAQLRAKRERLTPGSALHDRTERDIENLTAVLDRYSVARGIGLSPQQATTLRRVLMVNVDKLDDWLDRKAYDLTVGTEYYDDEQDRLDIMEDALAVVTERVLTRRCRLDAGEEDPIPASA